MHAVMKLGTWLGLVLVLGVAACGEVRNPFEKPKVFAATPYPADFAVVVDESPNTNYARQNIHQVISADSLMSRATYTTFSDYQNAVAGSFTREHPVTQAQMQALWNEVVKNDLLDGGEVWYYWKSNPDSYLDTEHRLQIKANGRVVTFKTRNHWGYKLRDLALLVRAIDLPVTQKGAVLPGAAATGPAMPTTAPATTDK